MIDYSPRLESPRTAQRIRIEETRRGRFNPVFKEAIRSVRVSYRVLLQARSCGESPEGGGSSLMLPAWGRRWTLLLPGEPVWSLSWTGLCCLMAC